MNLIIVRSTLGNDSGKNRARDQRIARGGCPEISLFALFSGVAAVGSPWLSHGERVDFGFVCSPDGWNKASPSLRLIRHMHITVLNR